MKILIVIPDHQTAQQISHRASERGHRVLMADGMKDAQKITEERPFDLSFIHLRLPDGDGLGLIKDMKERHPGMHVVAVINTNARHMELAARQLGVIYYMVEPFDAREADSIVDYLSQKESNY